MSHTHESIPDIFLPNGALREDWFAPDTLLALRESLAFTLSTQWDCVRSPHVFMGLLSTPDHALQTWGELIQTNLGLLAKQFEQLFHQSSGPVSSRVNLHREFLSDNVLRVLRDGVFRAQAHRRKTATPMDLLITLLTTPNSIVAECFERVGFTTTRLTELAIVAEETTYNPDALR